jgi:hypothetical protein
MEYPQSPASLYEAVVNGRLTHSEDSRLARHIGNAVLREDARYDPEVPSCPGAIARTGRLGLNPVSEADGPSRGRRAESKHPVHRPTD